MRWRSGLIVLIATLSVLPLHGLHAADRCAGTGENLLAKVKSWADLHRWFKDYADCDANNLTDDVAEYVTSSLARNWKDFPQLEQEIKQEPRFQEFVLHHIDTITPIENLKAVKKNAERRCPAGSEPLCAAIVSAVQSALDEMKQER